MQRSFLKRIILILCSLLATAGCSKVQDYQIASIKHRQECMGDITVKCRVSALNLQVLKLKAVGEMLEGQKERIVACKGAGVYDEGLRTLSQLIDSVEDAKPNIFMRTFMSDASIEFNPHFKHEDEFVAFMSNIDACRKPQAASVDAKPRVAGPTVLSDSGPIDSNAPTVNGALNTVAGTLVRRESTEGNRALLLNGQQLFQGDDANWQFPVRVFKLSAGREAILLASSGGRGNSCETLFFFLLADRQGVKPTPEFGTCAPVGTYAQRGDMITLTIPKMGGHSVFGFDGVTVTEDGAPVKLDDSSDPSK